MIPVKILQELIEHGKRMEAKLDELHARLDKALEREPDGIMTDRDLNHILAQDDIIAGINAWNKDHRPPRRKARRAA
jgi:hypothetical protein